MTSPAEYEPWTKVENIDVPITGLYDINGGRITHIRVPYVYSEDAQGVQCTASIVAWVVIKVMESSGGWIQLG